MILGRDAECAEVEALLHRAADGLSGVLVVRGEAGIGKTALLEHARDAARTLDYRVETTVGVESEIGLAFAGLHQICAPLLDGIDSLPPPQRNALEVAFGLSSGEPPNPVLVGLAGLTLLASAGEDRPLLCVVDDAQWLDTVSVQNLSFIARRLRAEPVVLLAGMRGRPGGDVPAGALFRGLPELHMVGLPDTAARELLASTVQAPLDHRVRDRIVTEAAGNPLALLEFSRAAPAALGGGYLLPGTLSVPDRVEENFRRRSGDLPRETQLLLLIAAAEPTGDVVLLRRAGDHLGIEPEAAAPAIDAGLVEVGIRVRFAHPLVRSAVYRAASPGERRRAHAALAAATDPMADPDRSAWHRAQAVLSTDEAAAAELERSAGRARARGGLAAAAAFLQRATELTPVPDGRARRALTTAHALFQAGAPNDAVRLLSVAATGPTDDLHRARTELLRAQIAYHTTRGRETPGMLLSAARGLAPLDARLSRETYLQALEAAALTSPLCEPGVRDVAVAARAAPDAEAPARTADLLLEGMVARFTRGYATAAPIFREALASLPEDDDQWLWLACRVAVALWDDERVYALVERAVRSARESGALAALPAALNYSAAIHVHTGDLVRAVELGREAATITQTTAEALHPSTRLLVAAWRGRRTEAIELAVAMRHDAERRGEGGAVSLTQVALTVLHNGLGDYESALDAAAGPCDADDLVHSSLALPDLVEAANRAGRPGRASAAAEILDARARSSGTQWALGIAARSRALTSTGPAAEDAYREAVERLAATRMTTYLARTHLVYGEWLRRRGRRVDARDQLRTAHDLLSEMGMEAFAARAANELRATGEYPHRRTSRAADALTPHELDIARLVAAGATSKEVAARLYLSPRTIDAHLRNIFPKLGITSRRQLRDLRLG